MYKLVVMSVAVALLGASTSSFAQPQSYFNIHPVSIIQRQDATPVARYGGIEQQGIATPSAASPALTGFLPPGPAAGAQTAAVLSNAAPLIGGGSVSTAVVCAIACLSATTTTTTTSTRVAP